MGKKSLKDLFISYLVKYFLWLTIFGHDIMHWRKIGKNWKTQFGLMLPILKDWLILRVEYKET